MNGNAKQRVTLTNLSEPQQMRELNRQMSWIWDQLLGGLSLKALNSSARAVIDSKASYEDTDELRGRVEKLSTNVLQTQEEIQLKAEREELEETALAVKSAQSAANAALADVEALDQRVTQTEAELAVQADQIELRVTRTEHEEELSGKLDADEPSVGVVASGITINERAGENYL